MNIDKYVVSLEQLIKNINNCYGHVKDDQHETIVEHIQLCIKYLKEIFELKRLDKIMVSFKNNLVSDLSDEGKEVFNELFINTIVFHDNGKINPIFQNDKMNNRAMNYMTPPQNLDSKHSILSAYIYLGYFLNKISSLDKNDYKILKRITYINAFVISRHHSKIDDFRTYFIDKFDSDDKLEKRIIDWVNSDEFVSQFNVDFNFVPLKKNGRNGLFKKLKKCELNKQIDLYAYVRLLYSILVTCDYYATSEFYNNQKDINVINDFDFKELIKQYDNTKLITKIRKKQILENSINELRTEIFLEAEKTLIENYDKNIFYLEAPTGSGKSNTAINLSLRLIEKNNDLNKIVYVYPFNTLVEQNIASLNKIFDHSSILNNVAVVNSTTPIKIDENKPNKYQKALLDRQFLNYPIILTTHVSLFDTLFGNNRESAFGFYQFVNTVIVLDEIKNYRIERWNEIIIFLKEYARILNMKIIIMSATLPNLEVLTNDDSNSVSLIKDCKKYFLNPIFKERVKIDYSLLEVKNVEEVLFEHVLKMNKLKKKIMLEFIVRRSAEKFYRRLKNENLDCEVLFISGFDSILEREIIIDKVNTCNHLILVATQVVEAGVDIDMDIGYKDISKLDSEEQFMGRINRSCLKDGVVYFFNLNKAANIYKKDERVAENLTLLNDEMKAVLLNKSFNQYYQKLLTVLKHKAKEYNDGNVGDFFREAAACLNYKEVSKRMELILDTRDRVTIFLGRKIKDFDGHEYDGNLIWKQYVELLQDNEMDYSKKIYQLSVVKSKMNYFMYQVDSNCQFDYEEQIGDIFYIEDGDNYILDGKLNTGLFETENELFI